MAPKRKSAREATPTTKKKEAQVLKAKLPAKVTKETSPAKKTTATSTPRKVSGRVAKKTPAKDLTDMSKETMAKNAVKSGKKAASPAKSATKKTTTKKATPAPAPEPDDDEDDDPLGTEGLYVEEPAEKPKTKKQSPKVKDKTYRDHHDPADDAVEDEPEPEKPRRAGRKGSVYKPDADDEENEDGDAPEPPKRGRGRPRKSDSSKKGAAKAELAAKSGSGKRGRPKKVVSRPAGPLSQKDATAALRQQAEIMKKTRHTLAGPEPEATNHLRAAFYMLKSALFGGGLYAKASKAEARRLRGLCQGMDDDIASAVINPDLEEYILGRNLRWTDVEGTGEREDDVAAYLTRFPVYDGDGLAEMREEMEDLGMWEDDPKGLAEYLTGRIWDVLKECRYGMAGLGSEDAVEGLEAFERQWKLLTMEDPDNIVLGMEEEEAAMKNRVRRLWRTFEEGAAQTARLSIKEVGDADSTTEDEDEQMLDEDVVVPTIEPTTTTARKASKSTTSRNGRTPSPLKPSCAPLRSPSRSPAARNKAQPGSHPGHIRHNEQTRLATPRASPIKTKGTPSPSPQTKQRREGVQSGFSTTPNRGSGASAGSLRSAEEAAASAAQLQDEMADGLREGYASVSAAGSKRGPKAPQSRPANDNAGESSRFSHHTATTSSSKEPFRVGIKAGGGSNPSDDDDSSSSDHGFAHLPPSRRPSRRSTSPAPLRPPPDRSGITGPPVGSRERLQEVLRHVATAEEQRVFDGYEERVVKLPKKYYEGGEANDDGDAGDDDDVSGRHTRRSPAKSPRPSPAPVSRPSRSRGSDGKEEDPWAHRFTTATNPERIQGLDDRPNPFHEKLPGTETWYQRMPNVFPFGETPWQEREMSRQINEDLNRSHEREVEETNRAEASKDKNDPRSPSVTERIAGAIRGTLFGRTQTPEEQTPAADPGAAPAASTTDSAALPPGPWDSPEVEDQRVEDGLEEFHEFFRHVEHKGGPAEARRESREKKKKRTQQEAAEGGSSGKRAKKG